MYVIKCTDHGGFVSKPGSRSAYTDRLQNARQFESLEWAEANKCPENEIVLTLEQAMNHR